MREIIRQFVKTCAETLPIREPIYEFGSMRVPGQEELADLRPFFMGKEYVGCDMQDGLGVDKIINLHHINLPSNSVGTALLLETIEHVEFPHRAVEEIYRVLQPTGMIIISSTMNFPIHNYPYDYWRFTPEAFKSLLKPFSSTFVGYAGRKNFPHTIVGVGFKGFPALPEQTRKALGANGIKNEDEWITETLREIAKTTDPPLTPGKALFNLTKYIVRTVNRPFRRRRKKHKVINTGQ